MTRITLPRLAMLGLVSCLAFGQSQAADTLSPAQRRAIDARIHDYILAHPDIVVDALRKAQSQAEAQAAADAKVSVRAHQDELLNDPTSPVLGNPKGDVTLVEFFDYRCPYCKLAAPTVKAMIEQDPKLRVVMKEFPILGPSSVFASKVALVAARHGRYTQFHDAMFALKGQLDDSRTIDVAQSVGLDPKLVRAEMTDPAIQNTLDANVELARTIGVDGTPAFIAGGVVVPGAHDAAVLKQLIAAARQQG